MNDIHRICNCIETVVNVTATVISIAIVAGFFLLMMAVLV